MSTVTKADLVEAVYSKVGFSKKDAQIFVEAFFDSIKEAAKEGESIKLPGFGTFLVRAKKPRKGRNPKTGEEMMLPGRLVMTFRPSRFLREYVNGEDLPKFLLEDN